MCRREGGRGRYFNCGNWLSLLIEFSDPMLTIYEILWGSGGGAVKLQNL